jgi:cell division protein FtsL
MLPVATEWWVEKSLLHMLIATFVIAVTHLVLRHRHRNLVRQNCNLPTLEDGEEDFPMKLGLRY